MKKALAVLVLAVICIFVVPAVVAQSAGSKPASTKSSVDQDIQLLRQDLASDKKQLFASNLVLTDAEATKFWPVYDQYQAEYKKIGDAKVALIKDYAQNWGTVTDAQALQYWQRSQEIEQSVLALRQKYVPLVGQTLPGKKTVTFFQLDRRIALLLDVQLAAEIPLVQEQAN
jgi:hypothetical protein